jgi:RNA polymerase sigma factor (sigma-70 family)
MAVKDGTGSSLTAEADVELLRLVRAGHDAAFGELFARHAGAVRGYALRCCADVADAEDMAAEAFFRVLQAVRRGSGPDDNVRGYLLTVVRRLAAEWSVRRRDVPVAADELSRQVDAGYAAPVSRADLQLIARAFTTLPQRWRTVLWRVEVEGERPAVVARHFGLSANATAALARRARQGLQAAYLQAHLAPAGDTGCRTVVDKLGAFTAGQVTGAEVTRISQHLAGCPSCQALHAELEDVCAGLRRYAGELAPGGVGGALGAHHALAGHHALIGKAGIAVGRLAAAGARLKLVVAAVSMAAVGGFGVAAGPIISQLNPSPNADRGIAVGPVLLSQVPSAGQPASVAHRAAGDPFDSTMRAELRGPAAHRPPPPGQPTVTTLPAIPPQVTGSAGAPVGSSQALAPTTVPVPTSTDSPVTMDLQGAQEPVSPTTTDDPVTVATTPTGRPVPEISVTPTDDPVGSTSWTTDGTTVWEWSWTNTPG